MGHNYTYARHHGLPKWERTSLLDNYTVLVKSFAHLNRNFFLASLEEIGKLWKWWTVDFFILHYVQS